MGYPSLHPDVGKGMKGEEGIIEDKDKGEWRVGNNGGEEKGG